MDSEADIMSALMTSRNPLLRLSFFQTELYLDYAALIIDDTFSVLDLSPIAEILANDHHEHYTNLINFLNKLSPDERFCKLYFALIYKLALTPSLQTLKIVKWLCSLIHVAKFENIIIWGLCKNMKKGLGRNARYIGDLPPLEDIKHLKKDQTTIIDSKTTNIKIIVAEKEIEECAKILGHVSSDSLEILDYIKQHTRVRASYSRKSQLPFFLEPFFEIYMYHRFEQGCTLLKDKNPYEIRQISLDKNKELFDLTNMLHSILQNLITKSKVCRKYFLMFVRKLFVENFSRNKMVYNRFSTVCDGFSVNFTNVLDKFCEKIVENNLINRIDLTYVNRVINDVNKIKDKKAKEKYQCMDAYKVGLKYNEFVTTMFTYNILFYNLSYGKLFSIFESLRMEIMYLEDENVKSISQSYINAHIGAFMMDMFKDKKSFFDMCARLALEKSKNDAQPTKSDLSNNKSNISQNIQSLSISNDSSNQNSLTDTQYLESRSSQDSASPIKTNSANINFDIQSNNADLVDGEELPYVDEFYNAIITYYSTSSQFYIHPSSKLLTSLILKMLNSAINLHSKEKLLDMLANEKLPLNKSNFDNLIKIYLKCSNLDERTKYKMRICIQLIFETDSNMNLNHLDNEKFLFAVILDLEQCLSMGLDTIQEIKILQEKIKNLENTKANLENILNQGISTANSTNINPNLQTNADINDPTNNSDDSDNSQGITDPIEKLKQEIKNRRGQAAGSFEFTQKSFETILRVSLSNPKLFACDTIKQSLFNTINYNLKLLVGPKCTSFTVKNMETFYFYPKKILALLLKVIIHLNDAQSIVTNVINNQHFNEKIYKRAYDISFDKKILDDDYLAKFQQFVEQVQAKSVETISVSIPDEFIDPLTCEMMNIPIMLTTSNVVVDKSSFDMILMNDCTDPFNRAQVTPECGVVQKDLMEKIREFKKQNNME